MADLAATITHDGGGAPTYSLPVENLDIDIARQPTQAPPGANVDPILIDLGFFTPSIVVDGVVETTARSDGSNTIPSKQNIEDIKDWYSNTITFTADGDSYEVKISRIHLNRLAGRHGRYSYSITMVAKSRS